MQPIGHPVVGYVCYAGYTRARYGDRPDGAAALLAVCAAMLPDLIDKPLWLVGVTPVGRTVGHSLLGVLLIGGGIGAIARSRGRPDLATAVLVGYSSHVVADVPWHVLVGAVRELGFLLWPITETPAYTGVKPIGTAFGVEVTTLWIEAALFVAGGALWWTDGRPGWDVLRRRLRAVMRERE